MMRVRDKHKTTKEDKDKDVFNVNIPKNRHGIVCSMELTMNKEIARISDIGKIKSYEDTAGGAL